MPDLGKVIKGLKRCSDPDMCDNACPYYKDYEEVSDCTKHLALDAMELLKEQEAVEPILEQDSMVCRICGHEVIWQKTFGDGIWVDEKLDFCPHCGRKVKWND